MGSIGYVDVVQFEGFVRYLLKECNPVDTYEVQAIYDRLIEALGDAACDFCCNRDWDARNLRLFG